MLVVFFCLNTLRPRQDGRHFADDSFTCIFFNENCCILIKFSLKYVRKGPIDNNRALVQIMAWRRSGDKPLSEPMMISLPTHIYASLGLNELTHQWINHHWFRQWLVAWPAPSHYLNQCWDIVNWTLGNKLQWNQSKFKHFHSWKCIWKCCLRNDDYFDLASVC